VAAIIHFIDVGQGNMVLIETESGSKFIFDCNVTDENEERVLGYVAKAIGLGRQIRAFICSHRDADHIRGVKKLHARFPIREIWDSGYPGTTTDSPEYRAYMDLRLRLGSQIKVKKKYRDYGRTRFNYLSAKDDRLPKNANAQGIIIKVDHRSANGSRCLSSAMLTGDSDAETWRQGVMVDYTKSQLSSSILMGAHHGSITFFDDPNENDHYYVGHIQAINPEITLISVGPNSYGHPNEKALKLYRKYSSGSKSRSGDFMKDNRAFGA